jgi:pre-mRNA-splicing factor SYF1
MLEVDEESSSSENEEIKQAENAEAPTEIKQQNESEEESEDPVEAKFQRIETLIQRRPFLLSNIVLRQNPNNVYEWLNRIKLCEHDTFLVIKTFTEAIKTIDPLQAFGKCS